MSRRDEDGAAVVMALALIAALMVLAIVAAGIVAIVATHRQLQAGADLAALAGASAAGTSESPCAAAARIAERNGGSVTRCTATGAEVLVVVAVRLPRVLGGATLRARARAGPALGVEDEGEAARQRYSVSAHRDD